MSGFHFRIPSPETLYTVWQVGWTVGGACLLWRVRSVFRREPDGRTGWTGHGQAAVVFFVIYAFAWLMNLGLSAGIARELARFAPEIADYDKTLFSLVNPAMMALLLLCMRRFAAEFSPQRPHRMKPAGAFGFTPAGLLRGFAGGLALVTVVSLLWCGVLMLAHHLGLPDYAKSQDSVLFIAGAKDLRVIAPFLLGATVFAPIHEELFYRAGLFAVLRGRMPALSAYILCGAVFALMHFSVFAFLPLLVFGAWLARLYDETADIRVPIFVHAAFNLASVIWAVLAPGAVA